MNLADLLSVYFTIVFAVIITLLYNDILDKKSNYKNQLSKTLDEYFEFLKSIIFNIEDNHIDIESYPRNTNELLKYYLSSIYNIIKVPNEVQDNHVFDELNKQNNKFISDVENYLETCLEEFNGIRKIDHEKVKKIKYDSSVLNCLNQIQKIIIEIKLEII